MISIGNLTIKSKTILAPMAGVTDLPYRLINREYGCHFAFTEMVHARGLAYDNRNTWRLLKTTAADQPLGIQLVENSENFILDALERTETIPHDIIDFNAACPAKKIIRKGGGAALMKQPDKLQIILKLLVNNSKRPVTLKIRTGWDANNRNALDIARLAQDTGISAIFVHGRTRMQQYSGDIDYKIIRELKKLLDIPVIASGNIFDPKSAEHMITETGCDGVLIARGSYGNPWIFSSIETYLNKGKLLPLPGIDKVTETMKKHLDLIINFYGHDRGSYLFRRIFVYYTKTFSNIKSLRIKVFHITKYNDLLSVIEEFRQVAKRHPYSTE